jgi:Glyoxalase-like domain
MHVTRLRQVVVAAQDLQTTVRSLQTTFGLGEAFPDPGVGEFGLANGVLPVGDQFVEVVSPITPGSAAGRWMQRQGGDAGYMVMFQVESMGDARAHLSERGLRTVWSADLADISGTHVHPADIGGAIVSFDEPRPPASWRWGGPTWASNVSVDVVRAIAGITMAGEDPDALAAAWAGALNLPVVDRSVSTGDGSTVMFVPAAGHRAGLVGIDLAATDANRRGEIHRLAGVDFRLV